ncbi:His-Xaa-Ser system radical SAM maturase HxsB [Pseudoduganella violacea]|uniref:His-Xaa-Ser system radical SAM maturase HxsB n=1 Tax=Pseudoduganella violacea TaxID=1715466 RepID=A0A7W5FWW7_9BURK|nr:His-Xaa-Ser system radical SAM maturase HxsB [Pseudoduganella violacea]
MKTKGVKNVTTEGNDLVIGTMRIRRLPSGKLVAVSEEGDWEFLDEGTLAFLERGVDALPIDTAARLLSKFLIDSPFQSVGMQLLKRSRLEAKRSTVQGGTSLHIIVPTLQCAHSCKYCQVSRALESQGHTMSIEDLDAACDSIFESPSPVLTVEFQGGDPLLRFDLVQRAILRIEAKNASEGRSLRFVVASTLHQLTPEMCGFFKQHGIFLSTSIDGPAALHNQNRPTRERDAYERTLAGIELARAIIGPTSVSALMTTTRASLGYPHEIVDEYVRLGLPEIFLRPLSSYGFAKRNQSKLGYSVEEFHAFYEAALERVLWWNSQGVQIREVYASIICNKILSTFDAGYVDLQSPTGAGASVLVYNYDGYVYPSDEARMLAETGDVSLRMMSIGGGSMGADILGQLRSASEPNKIDGCWTCAYHAYCGPNPVDAQAQHGSMLAPVRETEHCARHLALFDGMFERIAVAPEDQLDLFHLWARPAGSPEAVCEG